MNVLVELLSRKFLGSEEAVKLNGRMLNRRKKDLALIAAHAKFGIDEGRLGEMLIHPIKCTTIWAVNIEMTKVMNLPGRIKGEVCQRQRKNRLRLRRLP